MNTRCVQALPALALCAACLLAPAPRRAQGVSDAERKGIGNCYDANIPGPRLRRLPRLPHYLGLGLTLGGITMKRAAVLGISTLGLILIILLVLFLLGAFPGFGMHSYGYGPSGLLLVVLIVVVVLIATNRL